MPACSREIGGGAATLKCGSRCVVSLKRRRTMRPSWITTWLMDAVVGAAERERSRAGGVGEELADDAAVRHDNDPLVGVGGDDALHPVPHAGRELLRALGARDRVPALLLHRLHERRVALDRLDPQQAALPLAEEHLAQVGLHPGLEPEARRQGCRRLGSAAERRDVDRGDRLTREAVGRRARPARARRGRAAGRRARRRAGTGSRGRPAATRRAAPGAPRSHPAAARSGAGGRPERRSRAHRRVAA